MPKVASMMVKFMKEKGCETVFGVPGKPVVPLILAMEESGISFVLARHEGGAGFMATGYALQTGGLGVAIGTSGPGGTNMITAAAQAQAFHAPVLFITGHPPLSQSGMALGQDSSMFGTDLVALFKPVTKFSAKVESKGMLKRYLQHAEEQALTGAKGPVHLSVPLDILIEEVDEFTLSRLPVQDHIRSGNIQLAIKALNRAKRPLMLVGKGAHFSGAYKEVEQVAEKWSLPVVTTPGGKGTFVTDHPLSLGSLGLGGTEGAAAYVKDKPIDLLLVVGSKLSDMSTVGLTAGGMPSQVLHFDYQGLFVGKSLPADTLFVQGDAKINLQQLLLEAKEFPQRQQVDLREYRDRNRAPVDGCDRLSTAQTMGALREVLPADTVVYGDDGSHTFYAIKHFRTLVPGTFYFDDVFGAMGHAIGLSIGAKMAQPQRPIACFTGDGCLYMHGTEIATAVDQKTNVLFVVFNNGMLDMVDKGMKHNLGRTAGTRYEQEINAALFAESLGAKGFRCNTVAEVKEAVQKGNRFEGPVVVEVMVSKEETPPTLGRG